MAKYVSAQEVRNAIGKAKVAEERATIEAMAKLGYDALMYAYKRRDFNHQTRNLHDSYGSAVYYNGQLIPSSIRYIGGELSRKADPKTKMTGRQTLDDFFKRSHYGRAKGEMVLVCVAAMYYTKFLEEGSHGGGYKIQVISAARDYVDQNYSKYLSTKQRSIVFKGIRPISNENDGLL